MSDEQLGNSEEFMHTVRKSKDITELCKALAKAQVDIENPIKDSQNPHFKSKYADLSSVLNCVRKVFPTNGLSVMQHPSFKANVVFVETVIMHTSGQWMSSVSSCPINKQDAQGVGSAITYLRRYSLSAVCGIAQEDDDGNAATDGPRLPHAKSFKPVHGANVQAQWESLEGAKFVTENGSKKSAADVLGDDDIPDWDAPKPTPKEVNKLPEEILKLTAKNFSFPTSIAKIMKAPTIGGNPFSEFSYDEATAVHQKLKDLAEKAVDASNKKIIEHVSGLFESELARRESVGAQ